MSTSPSTAVSIFGYSLVSIEMITCVAVLAIASLNLAVIVPTKLLHLNLKSILITQSIAIMLYVLPRIVMLFQKFTSNDPFAPANVVLQNLIIFYALFRRLLGHALIIERFFATFCTNSYEKCSKLFFFIVWFSITFIISFVNTITNGQSWTYTNFNLITQSMSTILSVVEYLLITLICHYNRKKYSQQIEQASPNNYHIGQRYQVADNLKTAKQLSPAFLCLFLSNLFMNIWFFVIALNFVTENYQISLVFALSSWVDTIFGAAIEFTVLT
ncbi:hypothetical protein niasHS_008499 [Heterodera schachtii]|uniref:Gustatory receptor n=1 Tax=Heterodera schachtii TaxID=97005 RepID=A0ABD2JET6_HETSC